MSGYGIAAWRSVGLCVVIGLLGACATRRQGVASSEPAPGEWVEHYTEGCTGGHDVPQDLRRAAAMFEQSCEGGLASGCFNLGVSYVKGSGVSRDRRRAAEMFEKACKAGEAQGCTALHTF